MVEKTSPEESGAFEDFEALGELPGDIDELDGFEAEVEDCREMLRASLLELDELLAAPVVDLRKVQIARHVIGWRESSLRNANRRLVLWMQTRRQTWAQR